MREREKVTEYGEEEEKKKKKVGEEMANCFHRLRDTRCLRASALSTTTKRPALSLYSPVKLMI